MEEQRYYCQVHSPKPKSRRGSRSCQATPRTSLTPEMTPYHLQQSPLLAAAAQKLMSHRRSCDSDSNFLQLPDHTSYGNLLKVSSSNNDTAQPSSHDDKQAHSTTSSSMPDDEIKQQEDSVCGAVGTQQLHHRKAVCSLLQNGHRQQVDMDNPRDMDGPLSHNDIWYEKPYRNNSIDKCGAHGRYREDNFTDNLYVSHQKYNAARDMPVTTIGPDMNDRGEEEEEEEPVWLKRDSILQKEQEALVKKQQNNRESKDKSNKKSKTNAKSKSKSKSKDKASDKDNVNTKFQDDLRKCALADPGLEFFLNCGRHDILAGLVSDACRKEKALAERRAMIVEWQTIATVIDRLLFWIFLIGTLAAYVIILFAMPWTKPSLPDDVTPFHVLKNAPP